MSSSHDPKQNHLLAALRADDYARLLPDLEFTQMPLVWVVYEAAPWDSSFFSASRLRCAESRSVPALTS